MIARPEFGSNQGKIMIITRALYGLKSSGASFRALLSKVLWDMPYRLSRADPDVYMRRAVKKMDSNIGNLYSYMWMMSLV